MRTNMARIAFLEADNDERIKRAMTARISSNANEFYEPGDMISFKEKNKNKWAGPAKVLAVDGKVLMAKYGNNLRHIHKSKAVKVGHEYSNKRKIYHDEAEDTANNNDDVTKSPSLEPNETEPFLKPKTNEDRRKTSVRRP